MGEFRIGRVFARHTYPEPRRGGGASAGAFARNFASGPASETTITVPGVQVPWAAIDVGSPGTDVPITPQSTGIIRIDGAITLKNHSGDSVVVVVSAQVNGVDLPFPLAESISIPTNSFAVVPILAETTALPVGTPVNIQILVASDDSDTDEITIVLESSTLGVQEVSAATG